MEGFYYTTIYTEAASPWYMYISDKGFCLPLVFTQHIYIPDYNFPWRCKGIKGSGLNSDQLT